MSHSNTGNSVAALEGTIVDYLKERVLDGDEEGELTAFTPLLGYGILNSIRTASLLSFLRQEAGVDFSLANIEPTDLADAHTLALAILRVG